MFPGLHPAAMMSTIGLSNNYRGNGANVNGGGNQQAPANRQQAPQVPPPVQTESCYLYIPNAAVGAIIGKETLSFQNRQG